MSEKLPQPTDRLVHRLQRIAKWLDAGGAGHYSDSAQQTAANKARANTCWQCAGRLEELEELIAKYRAERRV